jgi:DNA-binding transcriptional MocR family regulator
MMASPLLVSLITGWIRDGTAAAILTGIRTEAVARQALAAAVLPREYCAAHPEGLHLWLTLPPIWQRQSFVAYVRAQGLALVPSDAFTTDGRGPLPNAVRVALGVSPDHGKLLDALKLLKQALMLEQMPGLTDIV